MAQLHETIACLSNASLDLFPDNTLTRFTHRLPRPIEVPRGYRALVALRSMILNCKPEASASDVGFVKVHLEELDPVPGPDVGDRNVLHRLPFQSGRLFWHNPDFPIVCPLAPTTKIDQFSFVLTDEQNKQLKLEAGPTTFIVLTIIMTTSHRSFSVTVSPDTSGDLFNTNSLHNWSVELPETMTFTENWEVALVSAQAGKSLCLENGRLKFVLHTTEHFEDHARGLFAPHDGDVVLTVPTRQRGLSEDTLIRKHLNPWLNTYGYSISLNKRVGSIALTHERGNEVLTPEGVLAASSSEPDKFATLEVSATAAKLLNLRQDDYAKGSIFRLPKTRTEIRGRVVQYDEAQSRIPYNVELVEHLAVYCDLVEHSIIGNEIAPFMDVLPAKKLHLFDTDKHAFFAVKHPIYRRVSPHVRKTFNVAIRSLDGSIPNILHDLHTVRNIAKNPIVLTFVFKWRD